MAIGVVAFSCVVVALRDVAADCLEPHGFVVLSWCTSCRFAAAAGVGRIYLPSVYIIPLDFRGMCRSTENGISPEPKTISTSFFVVAPLKKTRRADLISSLAPSTGGDPTGVLFYYFP